MTRATGAPRDVPHADRRAEEGPGGGRALGVLIADDEPLARQALRDYVDEEPGLVVLGVAEDGPRAAERIDALRPDVVFLDVRMPGLSGLEVLDRIDHRPAIVFTTAYERFAVAAFELGAVDYLLKPFGRDRFREAVRRTQALVDGGSAADGVARARQALRRSTPLERIFVRDGERFLPIETADITRVEASGDYARVHASGASHLLSVTLAELEERLDGARFVRVHRSHMVNLAAVREVRRADDRRLRVVLRDGSEVVASRSGSTRLRERF